MDGPPKSDIPNDTPPEVEALVIEGWRRMTPQERLMRMCDLNAALDQLQAARIRRQYGDDIPERELKLRLAALRIDRETMIAAFGWDPEVEGY